MADGGREGAAPGAPAHEIADAGDGFATPVAVDDGDEDRAVRGHERAVPNLRDRLAPAREARPLDGRDAHARAIGLVRRIYMEVGGGQRRDLHGVAHEAGTGRVRLP